MMKLKHKLARLSFKQRLLVSNLIVSLIILPLFGISLYKAFEIQAKLTEQQAMQAYSYNLLAASEIDNGQLSFNGALAAPGFHLPDSGLYALIRNEQSLIWHSDSFINPAVPAQWPDSFVGESQFNQIRLNGEDHFNWQLKVEFEFAGQVYPFTFHIIKNKQDYLLQLTIFEQSLWRWLIAIALIFTGLQFIWLFWFQQPLKKLSQEVEHIENGDKNRISENYPIEIASLNNSLNRLIQTEQQQRQRYKNTLADLAHSLKTPLAVIFNNSDVPQSIKPELDKINQIIGHQLKKAQTGQSSWQQGCKVAPIAKAIITSLEKIYHQKSIQFKLNCTHNPVFYGAEADLYELLGNLLDNAAKACHQKVIIEISSSPNLTLQVSDDGCGLSESQTQDILKRGHRADTYEAGHGIGLSIVQDLVSSYQGQLNINGKGPLGGACFTLEFNA